MKALLEIVSDEILYEGNNNVNSLPKGGWYRRLYKGAKLRAKLKVFTQNF